MLVGMQYMVAIGIEDIPVFGLLQVHTLILLVTSTYHTRHNNYLVHSFLLHTQRRLRELLHVNVPTDMSRWRNLITNPYLLLYEYFRCIPYQLVCEEEYEIGG